MVATGVAGSALRAVTLLELLARAAGARVVAPDAVEVGGDALSRRDRRRRTPRPARRGARAQRAGARGGRCAAAARGADRVRAGDRIVLVREPAVPAAVRARRRRFEVGLLGPVDLDTKQVADDLVLDDRSELLEHLVALGAVLRERILLRHGAQVDPVAHVLHGLEVLAPAQVDDLQDEVALDLAHELGAVLLDLVLVLVGRILLEEFDQLLAAHGGRVHLVRRDLRLVERLHLDEEVLVVLLLPAPGLRVVEVEARQELVHPRSALLREVGTPEDPPALNIDDHALYDHDVVVLEDVLARDEVLLLDLLLRVLDLLREDRGLHGLVVRDLEAVHDPVDPVACEEAHEVVLRGEVEARLARVALAARAATELIVDPSRLVALGAEHIQPAALDDALAELDVDAAAGHVRRDRDRTRLTRVLDDLAL